MNKQDKCHPFLERKPKIVGRATTVLEHSFLRGVFFLRVRILDVVLVVHVLLLLGLGYCSGIFVS
jgi:hypothetical protein